MADRSSLYDQQYRAVQSAIGEFRDTFEREQDPYRPLTFLETAGFEEDSDKDRLDALKRISNLYSDPAYPLSGRVTRNTQEQAEQIRNFLRGVGESAAAGETDMADRVIDLVSAGDFGFESIERLQNPQESIDPITVTSKQFDRLPRPVLSNDPINVTSERFDRLTEPSNQNGPVGPAGRSDDAMSGRSLLRRALEASRTPIDMQRFEQLAQDRQRAGDLSMITSLAAGEAGPRYSGYQENYLKKALGEKEAQQLGDYGFASGGEFYETPGIQQGRELEANLAASELLFDAESDATKTYKKGGAFALPDGRIVAGMFDPAMGYVYETENGIEKLPPGTRPATAGMAGPLSAQQFNKLTNDLNNEQNSLTKINNYLNRFDDADVGLKRMVNEWSANIKTAFDSGELSPEELAQQVAKGQLQGLLGMLRLDVVGPGVMTEQDALRVIQSIGGDFTVFQNPEKVKALLEDIIRQKQNRINLYNTQVEFSKRFYPGVGQYGGLNTQPLSLSPSITSDNAASGAGENDSELQNIVNRYGLSR